MGTVIQLYLEHEFPEEIMAELIQRLKRYERRFSANDPDSELMAINKNAGIQAVSVHPELYKLIKIGKYHSCASDSHLNIAIGPLVQTWRIGFHDAKVPSADEIDNLLNKTNPEKIILDDVTHSVYLEEKGMFIDLGALAKGFIADLLVDYLKSVNVQTALINLGGNIFGLGPAIHHVKKHWKIGVQDPVLPRNHFVTVLQIVNESVVTSGIYERLLKYKGKTYHHILDPQTGYPISTDVASLTIRSKKSVEGEIWTTRLYGKMAEEIINYINQLDGIEGLVITKDKKILHSNHMFTTQLEGSKR